MQAADLVAVMTFQGGAVRVWQDFTDDRTRLQEVILRIIFQLKLADIVINTTAGGPGGATDTVSSFIFREYKDRSNVGYGTMIAEVYLILIIIFVARRCK